MTGLRKMVLSAAGATALACAPVAPASAALPLLALLGHLIVGHHAAAAAVRLTHAPRTAASAAAFVAQQSFVPYAYGYYPGAAAPYYAGSPMGYAPAYYSAPQRYYSPRWVGYYRAPGYYPTRSAAYEPRRARGYSRGYYRSEVSYPRSYSRAYAAPRAYGSSRASYGGSYAYRSTERVAGFGYRR